ncbi:MAG: hypothetical protein Q7S84_00510 [bacterium]|nr:hypothetical protein [bacterium]
MPDQNHLPPFIDTLSVEDALNLLDRGIPISEIFSTYPNIGSEVRETLTLIRSLERERDRVEPPRELLQRVLRSVPAGHGAGIFTRLMNLRRPVMFAVPLAVFAALALIVVNTLLPLGQPSELPFTSPPIERRSDGEKIPTPEPLKRGAPDVPPAPGVMVPERSGVAAQTGLSPIDTVILGVIDEGTRELAGATDERATEYGQFDVDTAAVNDFRGISTTTVFSSSSPTAAEFCATVSSTAASFAREVAERSQRGDARFTERSRDIVDARFRTDANRVAARATADAAQFGSLDLLIQEAPTTRERAALQIFRTGIMAALRTNRTDTDGARIVIREAFDDALVGRETRYRNARTTFSDVTTALFVKATQSCARNPKSTTAYGTARNALEAAEKAFLTTMETSADTSFAAAVQSHTDALHQSNERLNAAVIAVQDLLRKSLNE